MEAEDLKVCARCGEAKPRAVYGAQAVTRDGLRPYCPECHNALAAASQLRGRMRRRRVIVEAKDRPCADCGIKYPYYVMQFDHVRGEKAFTIAAHHTLKVKLEVLKEEIAKCDVVCANCHAGRTFMRRVATGSGPMHGPLERETYDECVCGCGRPPSGVRATARYASPACRQRLWRERTGYEAKRRAERRAG